MPKDKRLLCYDFDLTITEKHTTGVCAKDKLGEIKVRTGVIEHIRLSMQTGYKIAIVTFADKSFAAAKAQQENEDKSKYLAGEYLVKEVLKKGGLTAIELNAITIVAWMPDASEPKNKNVHINQALKIINLSKNEYDIFLYDDDYNNCCAVNKIGGFNIWVRDKTHQENFWMNMINQDSRDTLNIALKKNNLDGIDDNCVSLDQVEKELRNKQSKKQTLFMFRLSRTAGNFTVSYIDGETNKVCHTRFRLSNLNTEKLMIIQDGKKQEETFDEFLQALYKRCEVRKDDSGSSMIDAENMTRRCRFDDKKQQFVPQKKAESSNENKKNEEIISFVPKKEKSRKHKSAQKMSRNDGIISNIPGSDPSNASQTTKPEKNNFPIIKQLVEQDVYIDLNKTDRVIKKSPEPNLTLSYLNTKLKDTRLRFAVENGIIAAKVEPLRLTSEEQGYYLKISKIHFCQQKLKNEIDGIFSLQKIFYQQRKLAKISFLEDLKEVLLANPIAQGAILRDLMQNHRNKKHTGTLLPNTRQNSQIFVGFFSHRTRDLIKEYWPELLETTPSSSK